MTTIPYTLSPTTLTFYVKGYPYQVDRSSNLAWEDIKTELNSPEPDTDRLIAWSKPIEAVRQQIENASELLPAGTVSVTTSGVSYNGVPVNDALTNRMLDILKEGFDIVPWIKFMENLYRNPSETSRQELYLWLEKSELPITSDGHFLAYKRVTGDYKDIYTKTIDHSLGLTVELAEGRQGVDPERDRTCSFGLHFCSKSYLPSYRGAFGARILIVKINPADVVSIPSDYDNAKGRTWKYEIVGEIEEDDLTRGWGAVTDDYDYDYDDDEEDYYYPEDDYSDEDEDDLDEDEIAYANRYDELSRLGVGTVRAIGARNASNVGESTHPIWKVWSKAQVIDYILQKEFS